MSHYQNEEIRDRVIKLNTILQKEMAPCGQVISIATWHDSREIHRGLSLYRKKGVTFIERTEEFYRLLKQNLLPYEVLICENQCFQIKTKDYLLTYTLEGYRKNADMIGYYENGKAMVTVPNRMGVNRARWLEKHYYNSHLKTIGFTEDETEIIWQLSYRNGRWENNSNPAYRYAIGVRSVVERIKKDNKSFSETKRCADSLKNKSIFNVYIGKILFSVDDDCFDAESIILDTEIGFFRIGNTIDGEITLCSVKGLNENYSKYPFKKEHHFKFNKITEGIKEERQDAVCIVGEDAYITIFGGEDHIVFNYTDDDGWNLN